MVDRDEKITVRLTKYEKELILREAERSNMKLSVYMRERLLPSQMDGIFFDDIDSRRSLEPRRKLYHEVGNKLIQLQYYVEGLPEKTKNKDEMKGLLESLWQSLR